VNARSIENGRVGNVVVAKRKIEEMARRGTRGRHVVVFGGAAGFGNMMRVEPYCEAGQMSSQRRMMGTPKG